VQWSIPLLLTDTPTTAVDSVAAIAAADRRCLLLSLLLLNIKLDNKRAAVLLPDVTIVPILKSFAASCYSISATAAVAATASVAAAVSSLHTIYTALSAPAAAVTAALAGVSGTSAYAAMLLLATAILDSSNSLLLLLIHTLSLSTTASLHTGDSANVATLLLGCITAVFPLLLPLIDGLVCTAPHSQQHSGSHSAAAVTAVLVTAVSVTLVPVTSVLGSSRQHATCTTPFTAPNALVHHSTGSFRYSPNAVLELHSISTIHTHDTTSTLG
jgi:hypothetical protein